MKYIILFLLLLTQYGFSQSEFTHDVYFDTDKYVVSITEENRLLHFISALDSIPIKKVSIYGFTDDRGSNKYNLKLSKNRANTIKNMFSGYGIDPNLITNVNGKGEILLKVLNESDVDKIRGLNRKVEITVIKQLPARAITAAISFKDSSVVKTTEDIKNGNVGKGDKIRLDKIYFKNSYSYITSGSKKTLVEIAKVLVENKNLNFTILGHVCCTQDSRDAVDKKTGKRNLSVARAQFIYNYLAKKGVDKKRMKYVGMRRKFPLGGEAKFDRRVEIFITHVSKD